jgi:hypothetical protein
MPRKLNQNQIDVLLLLYKFRFATSNLLTQKLKLQHRSSINSRLQILEDQEYIGRRYDKSYKLMNKPASYFMLPKGFAVLRGMDGISNNTLKNMYKDVRATDGFVERSLAIFSFYNHLEAILGERFDMFSKSELTGMEDMPEASPDGLIRFKTSSGSRAKERNFFMYYAEERQPLFAVSSIITKQLEYGDSEDWQDLFGKPPAVIIVCDLPALERRLYRQAGRVEDEAAKGQNFYTTTTAEINVVSKSDDSFLMPLKRMPDGRIPLTSA